MAGGAAAQFESFLLLAVGLLMIARRWVVYERVGHKEAEATDEVLHLLTASLVTTRGLVKIGISSNWRKRVLYPCSALPVVGAIGMYARFACK